MGLLASGPRGGCERVHSHEPNPWALRPVAWKLLEQSNLCLVCFTVFISADSSHRDK